MNAIVDAIATSLLVLSLVNTAQTDVFTAISHLEDSVRVEVELVSALRDYISAEERRLDKLRRFADESEELTNKALENVDDFLANPVNAFMLVKRLYIEWNEVINSTKSLINYGDLAINVSKHRANIPTESDLQGAAQALLRLQDVYKLRPSDIISGNIHGFQTRPLTWQDCFDLGKAAYRKRDHYHVDIWMNEALKKWKVNEERSEHRSDLSIVQVLDYLAFSHYREGNVKKALNISRELLKYEPGHARITRNVKNFQEEIEEKEESSRLILKDKPSVRPNSTYLDDRDAYEALCRGERRKPLDSSKVKCQYVTNGNYRLLLQPAKQEIMHHNPRVVLYHDVISDEEINEVIKLAKPKLRRSLVVTKGSSPSGTGSSDAEYRVSSGGWLEDWDGTVIAKLTRRISDISGLSTLTAPEYRHAEALQVVNYGLGGHYEPHFDHATIENSDVHLPGSRNRIATWMFYMSEVKAGGYTVFPEVDAFVPPVKNAAVFWYNLKASGESDDLTRHAGCPVLIGSKWVANKWIHEKGNELRRPCDLYPD
ncbi:prolyl 4-hydroxylase subunit alpha-1-like [Saccoglossus kowalevskii]|uniref:procollagen-proline 4-dioxygenase n=1 Tax=Saccoglossus kowalevskii TaxID=10224 RepID=A0A1C9TA73_SACKO|nr:prolyl 4-hydroxylase subunit alpha-1-like protein [Saccoglossus kowalevskii]